MNNALLVNIILIGTVLIVVAILIIRDDESRTKRMEKVPIRIDNRRGTPPDDPPEEDFNQQLEVKMFLIGTGVLLLIALLVGNM